jgi:hypothetical protein
VPLEAVLLSSLPLPRPPDSLRNFPAGVPNLELSRTVRTWEFLPVVGTRAGLFGTESGRFDAWVYPLRIFRSFHLTFHVGGRALPAETRAEVCGYFRIRGIPRGTS